MKMNHEELNGAWFGKSGMITVPLFQFFMRMAAITLFRFSRQMHSRFRGVTQGSHALPL